MFEGFATQDIDGVHTLVSGQGPPVLLIHGYPENHVMWHAVAPGLAAAGHTVVCPDLRGYGQSHKPPAGEGSVNYSKRAMAAELVAVMRTLGHERFAVAGHDRGGRVAYRMALDHPDVVTRLAVLDIVPTIEQWERLKGTMMVGSFHWPFLAQPHPFPERLIGADPEYFLRTVVGKWTEAVLADTIDHYVAAFTPEVVRGSCDDYRAGAGIDVELDRADREAGHRISCPTLALWGARSLGRSGRVLEIWQQWADDVQGEALDSGHFLPEEVPEQVLPRLQAFFAG